MPRRRAVLSLCLGFLTGGPRSCISSPEWTVELTRPQSDDDISSKCLSFAATAVASSGAEKNRTGLNFSLQVFLRDAIRRDDGEAQAPVLEARISPVWTSDGGHASSLISLGEPCQAPLALPTDATGAVDCCTFAVALVDASGAIIAEDSQFFPVRRASPREFWAGWSKSANGGFYVPEGFSEDKRCCAHGGTSCCVPGKDLSCICTFQPLPNHTVYLTREGALKIPKISHEAVFYQVPPLPIYNHARVSSHSSTAS